MLLKRAAFIVFGYMKLASRHALGRGFVTTISTALLSLTVLLGATDTPRPVIFILSGESPAYVRVASATEQFIIDECRRMELACDDLAFVRQTTESIAFEDIRGAYITVSLGTKATHWIEEQPYLGRQVNAMLPYTVEPNGRSSQGIPAVRIYIDQPYARYFELMGATIPRSARVGLLIHESNVEQIPIITESAEQHGFSLKTSIVSSDRNVGVALSYLLDDIDVLLALPDARIHNSHTISHILTTAYRNDIPVIGFSSAYVKAGATAAVYTSLEDIALQVSDTVIALLRGIGIEKQSQQATYFSISFNFEVARSLGLPPISPSEIKQAISKGVEQ